MKNDWPLCGYGWLNLIPVAPYIIVWIVVGGYYLYRSHFIVRISHINASAIHDQVAQGIAIAKSQRRLAIVRRFRIQRYVKLCAMCFEWPSYTFTPFYIALRATHTPPFINGVLLSLNFTNENWNLILAFTAGTIIFILRHWKSRYRINDFLLMRFFYPMTFDLFYIPILSTFLRLGSCVTGFDHIALPGGATCDCLNLLGVFWAIGFIGFVIVYWSTIHYKIHIEPLGETMDFRMHPSFQYHMVMVRTLYPIVNILVNNMNMDRLEGIVITFGLLVISLFLLIFAYKSQPCIGSGRVPNNLRVMSFSSSVYTTIVVLIILCANTPNILYYCLVPLPLVWLVSWRVNNKQAARYHVPDVSIHQLLLHRSKAVNLIGAIAALHVNPNNIHRHDLGHIVFQLQKLSKNARVPLLCRAYALRTLWFSHIENFLKAKSPVVGEVDPNTALSRHLWYKDRENLDRPLISKSNLADGSIAPQRNSTKRTKVACITTVPELAIEYGLTQSRSDPALLSYIVEAATRSKTAKSNHTILRPTTITPAASLHGTDFHTIIIGDAHWISHMESPSSAVVQCQRLATLAFDILTKCANTNDRTALHECALLLLQWYRSGYLRINSANYLQILTSLCATGHDKYTIDATHSLYQNTINDIFPMDLWLESPLYLNLLLCAVKHPSRVTVFKAVSLLAMVLSYAERLEEPPLMATLFTPTSAALLFQAFQKFSNVYNISEAIERSYQSLHTIQVIQKKPKGAQNLRFQAAARRVKQLLKSKIAPVLARDSGPSSRMTGNKSRLSGRASGAETTTKPSTLGPPVRAIMTAMPSYKSTLRAQTSFRQVIRAIQAKGKITPTYIIATPEILNEIDRRVSLRRQLVQKSELAKLQAELAVREHRNVHPGRISFQRHGIDETLMDVINLYNFAAECALKDFVATALDPELRSFLEPHLSASDIQSIQPGNSPRWRIWSRS
ncbi:hypothetical protein THRCLA_03935 [Thraustotheca clavata]|uniref:Uncharacterized protein n=1 Tax=Thraustotheca clavata TaxID=74557 RepID=A0A1W0A0G4_9STRA|nr:hypothetical protein THRCLA_03935 [Thraustotheca clavata]